MGTRLAGSLAARLRASGSVTSGGLRLLCGADEAASRGASSIAARVLASRSYSSGKEGESPSRDSVGKEAKESGAIGSLFKRVDTLRKKEVKDMSPRIPALQEAKDPSDIERIFERVDMLLEKKEPTTIIINHNTMPREDQDCELKVNTALAQQGKEFDLALATQKTYFEGRLADMQKDFDDKIDKCKVDIKEADTAVKVLRQKYDFFKDSNDLRINNVQYAVVKCMGGFMTFAFGIAVAYFKLKDHLGSVKGFKQMKDWLD